MQDSYMIKTDLGMVMYVPYMLKQMLGHLFLKGHEKPGVYFKKGVFLDGCLFLTFAQQQQ